MTVDKGRIEDLLRLAVKVDKPPLTGAINFHTKFDLPPGKGDLADRLNLNGKFDVATGAIHQPGSDGQDRDPKPQGARPAGKQRRGQQRVPTEGQFRARQRRDQFRGLTFTVTGAQVALDGKYGLEKEDLDFHGKLRMQAKISQTTTGVKSFVLKAVDPFFRKNGQTEIADQDYRPA